MEKFYNDARPKLTNPELKRLIAHTLFPTDDNPDRLHDARLAEAFMIEAVSGIIQGIMQEKQSYEILQTINSCRNLLISPHNPSLQPYLEGTLFTYALAYAGKTGNQQFLTSFINERGL